MSKKNSDKMSNGKKYNRNTDFKRDDTKRLLEKRL